MKRNSIPHSALLPRQKSFASLHILTRRASEGSEALPSLARRVSMCFFGAGVIEGIRSHPSGPAARVGFPSLQRAQIVQPACLEPVAPPCSVHGQPEGCDLFHLFVDHAQRGVAWIGNSFPLI